MQDQLRSQIINYLAQHEMGVLSTGGLAGLRAMPVHYRSQGLDLYCLVPRWADVLYHLKQDPQTVLVITSENPLCWLHYQGRVQAETGRPDWPGLLTDGLTPALAGELYQLLHLIPNRIDWIDERCGWGARATLE